MKFLRLVGSAVIGATMFVASASAQSLVFWDEVRGWDVMIDPLLGNGCLIMAEYQDNSVIRIGFDANEENGYLSAYNRDWGNLREGDTYPLIFDLDNERYTGEGTGLYIDDLPGVDLVFDNSEFLFDLARRQTLTLYDGESGEEVMAIDLDGSYAALTEAIECQKAQN